MRRSPLQREDETPCSPRDHDTCAAPLAVTQSGTYALGTFGARKDYALSCTGGAGTSYTLDVVATVTVPAGGPKDVDVWATTPGVPVAVALQGTCGQGASEIACGGGQPQTSAARVRGRALAPGTTGKKELDLNYSAVVIPQEIGGTVADYKVVKAVSFRGTPSTASTSNLLGTLQVGDVITGILITGVNDIVTRATVPVLVVYTLEDTAKDQKPLVQSFVNGMLQAMKWVKATPIDEVYRLVGEKHFAGVDPLAVKAEMEFDKKTWVYDGRIDKASFERGGKVWYRKGTDIPETRYEDVVDMSFLEAAKAKYK